MRKFKIGEKVRIIGQKHNHSLPNGKEVTIRGFGDDNEDRDYSYNVYTATQSSRFVFESDIEAVDDFVLPKIWHVMVTGEILGAAQAWIGHENVNTNHLVGMAISGDGSIDKGYNSKKIVKDLTGDYTYDFGQEITTEQFLKYVLKQEKQTNMEKKVVGYKTKVDLPDIAIGTVGTKDSTGSWVFTAVDTEWKTRRYTEETLKAKSNFFEPVYEDFKVGDKVICVGETSGTGDNSSAGWSKGKIFTIGSLSIHTPFRVLWPNDGGSGVYENHARLATEKEIKDYEDVKFGNYAASNDGNRIAFGCQKFTVEELKAIGRLFNSEINAKITIAGKEVTETIIKKLILKLQK